MNSKEDYLYIKDHFSKEQWLPAWKKLLEESKDWFFDKYLSTEDEATKDEYHKINKNESMQGEEVDASKAYTQMVYKTNPTAQLFRIGFTEEEVKSTIKEAEEDAEHE